MTVTRKKENIISQMINKEKFYRLMVWYHGFNIYFRYKHPVQLPGDSQFPGKWRFLTIWNVWLQIVFYLVVGAFSLAKSPAINSLRDTIFTTVVLPMSAIVSVMFWGIYAVDRELIFPVALEKLGYTNTMNHMEHSTILGITIVNMLLVRHTYPAARKGNSIICGVALAYVVWLYIVHHLTGRWAYPFLAVMSDTTRIAFLGVVCLFAVAVYNLGRVVSNKIHGIGQEHSTAHLHTE